MSSPTDVQVRPGVGSARPTVCAILAAHNRRTLTLAAIESVFRETARADVQARVVLVDDGSTDGTAAAVEAAFGARAAVISTNGDLFWAAAMALAERVAILDQPDYVLWLNDDVTLRPGCVSTLIAVSGRHDGAVAVGATTDPTDGRTTYSGLRRSGRHPLAFALVEPSGSDQPVESFNGNIVLVPGTELEVIGGLDGGFAHAYADLDFGLRLLAAGRPAYLAPSPLGSCSRNAVKGTWADPSLPVRERLRLLHSPKGAPPRSSARFLRRHGGVLWPAFLATPYLRLLGEAAMRRYQPSEVES